MTTDHSAVPDALTDVSAARATAIRSVLAALGAFPAGRALAGDLVAALASAALPHPVSVRQARRWLRWAVELAPGHVAREPKTDEGTWYALAPEAVHPATAPLSELEAIPPEARPDVAAAVLALLDLGGEAGERELARAIAAAADRGPAWGAMALDVARPYLHGLAAIGVASGSGEMWFALHPDVSGRGLAAWGQPLEFRLGGNARAVRREIRRRLGGERVRLGVGEAAVVAALSDLGGRATREELAAVVLPLPDRTAVLAALGAFEKRAGYPPIVELVRHGERGSLYWLRLTTSLLP